MEEKQGFKAERIIMLRNLLQLSQVNFAKKIHISQGALSQIENGKSQISLETLRNISNELNVDCNWIVNGTGEIFYPETKPSKKKVPAASVFIKASTNGSAVIPLVRSSDFAKYKRKYADPEYVKTLKMYHIPGFDEGTYRLFEIVEDNMAPTINQSEIVIAQHVESFENIESGSVAVLVTNDGIMVRKLVFYENDRNIIILKNDNSKHKSVSIEKGKVKEIWLIKSKITSDFVESGMIDTKRIESLEQNLDNLRHEVKKLLKK